MKIKDICTSVTDGSHNPPQGIEKSEYMMLSSKNIFDDEITFDEPRFLSEKDFEREHKRTQIAVGDVLLTIVGTVGRTAVVDEDMPAFALQRSVAVLHPKNDICLPRFLMYALRGKRTYIENRAKGVAQKGIYLKEVSDIDMYINKVLVKLQSPKLFSSNNIDSIFQGVDDEYMKIFLIVMLFMISLIVVIAITGMLIGILTRAAKLLAYSAIAPIFLSSFASTITMGMGIKFIQGYITTAFEIIFIFVGIEVFSKAPENLGMNTSDGFTKLLDAGLLWYL